MNFGISHASHIELCTQKSVERVCRCTEGRAYKETLLRIDYPLEIGLRALNRHRHYFVMLDGQAAWKVSGSHCCNCCNSDKLLLVN